jgi:hypothetical protein
MNHAARICVLIAAAILIASTSSVVFAQGRYQQASTRLLTSADIQGLPSKELKIMRNEIFARHGYIFKTNDMKAYFTAQPWYRPQRADVSSMLTAIEKKNVEFIKQAEALPAESAVTTLSVAPVNSPSDCWPTLEGYVVWSSERGTTEWSYYDNDEIVSLLEIPTSSCADVYHKLYQGGTTAGPDLATYIQGIREAPYENSIDLQLVACALQSAPDLKPKYHARYTGTESPSAQIVGASSELVVFGGRQMFVNGIPTSHDVYCGDDLGIVRPRGQQLGRYGDVGVREIYSERECADDVLVLLEGGSVAVLSRSKTAMSLLHVTELDELHHPVQIIDKSDTKRPPVAWIVQSRSKLFYITRDGATALPFAVSAKVGFARESISCDTDCGYDVATDFIVEQRGEKLIVFDRTSLKTHTLSGLVDLGIIVDCAEYDHYAKNKKTNERVRLRALLEGE